MAKKIELDDVTSGFNLSKINSNFQTIEDTLNDRVLFRQNTTGTPNQLETNVDANDKRIYNLPKPVTGGEPLRLKDLFGDVDELLQGPEAQHFTATAAQQVFTLVTTYVPGTNSLRVYRNGVYLPDFDYQEISTNQVRILEPIDAGDIISIVPVAVTGGGQVGEISGDNVGSGAGVFKDKTGDTLNFRTLVPGENVTITENNSELVISAAGGGGGSTTASNVGLGQEVFQEKVGNDLRFRRLRNGSNMNLTTDDTGIVVATTAEINTASNLSGTGQGLFASKSGADLRFKRIKAGTNITLSADANEITINGSGAGGTSIYTNVKDFGAVGDGVTDDTTAIQNAINAANPIGSTVFLPAGKYKITSGLVITNTGDTEQFSFKASMMGEGSAATTIIGGGGNFDLLSIYGGNTGAGIHSHQVIKGIFFQRADAARACVAADNIAFFKMEDVVFTGADVGLSCSDILSSLFDNCQFRFNNKGFRFERVNASSPNAITFNQCVIGNNVTYGGWAIGGTTFVMNGGSVEGNGSTNGATTDWGILLSNSGSEGAVSGAFHGTYFENNAGRADVWCTSSLQSSASSFTGCTFAKVIGNRWVTNAIFIDSSGTGIKQTSSIMGCGFKHFNDYTPNAGRKYIASTASGGAVNSIAWAGCMFFSATEAPSITNEITAGTPPPTEEVFAYGLALSNGGTSLGSKYKNIASIVRNGTGDYTWNFSVPSSVINPPVVTGVFQEAVVQIFALDSTYVRLFIKSRATGGLIDAVHSIIVY